MAIPLIGSPAPAKKPALIDLLKGPANLPIGSSIGAWTPSGTGTTCAFDATYGVDTAHGSMKLHTTTFNTDRYGSVVIPGTFKAGMLYHATILFNHSGLTTLQTVSYDLWLGDFGASDKNNQTFDMIGSTVSGLGLEPSSNVFHRVIVYWSPSADRTSVTIRVTRTGSGVIVADMNILEARVVAVPVNSAGLAGELHSSPQLSSAQTFAMMPYGGNARIGYGVYHRGGFTSLFVGPFGVGILGHPDSLHDQSYLFTSNFGTSLYANMSAIGRRDSSGWNEEYGPDYVGLTKAERSATEVEVYPDGDYDLFLMDGSADADTRHWWHEEADGAYKLDALSQPVGRRSRIGMYFQREFHVTGGQTTGNAKNEPAEYFQLPFPAEIDEVRAHLGTAPTGSTFIVDVNINGTTIFTTQANRPTVAISGTDATSGAPDTTKYAKNDRLSFDNDQVGSTIPGSDLTVMVRGRYLW